MVRFKESKDIHVTIDDNRGDFVRPSRVKACRLGYLDSDEIVKKL